jgi:cardiolipin synthase
MRGACRLVASLSAAFLVTACGTSPAFAPHVRAVSHVAVRDDQTSGRPFSLVTLPEQGPGVLLDAINGAKKSIDLEIYMITTSGAAGDIVQALIERSKAGVNVRVILEVAPFVPPTPPHCDSAPSLDINKKAREALMAGGVKVSYSSPRFKYTHEKAMLIDGQTAYVMTTNFTGAAFTNNREYILVDRTPADVASLAGIFDADWNATPYQPNNPALVLSPTNSRPQLRDLIDSAKRSIAVEVEFATDPELIAHLGAKAKAGVEVAVLVSAQGVDRCTGGDVDADEFAALHAAGVTKVAVMRKFVLHAKCIVVDGERAYIGSENLSANSLDHNREVGLLLSDKGVASKLSATIRSDWMATTSIAADLPQPDGPADPL